MPGGSRPAIWLSALAVAAFQVVGTVGASSNQPERKGLDALAIALVLLGPAALAVRDRWPVPTVATAIAAAAVSFGLGYAFGPIVVSIVVAVGYAVLRGHRRATWVVSAVGYIGFVIATTLDPRRGDESLWIKLSLIAGWWIVVLAVAEVVRSRRHAFLEHDRAEEEERQRLVAGWAIFATALAVIFRSVPLALGVGFAWAGPFENIIVDSWTTGYRVFPGQVLAAIIQGGTPDISLARAALTGVVYVGIAAVATVTLLSRRDVTS